MAIKAKFLVTGHGKLNGNLRVNIDNIIDNDLAQRLRVDKKALLVYVQNQYPGAEIVANSLTVRIFPIIEQPKETETKKSENPKSSSFVPSGSNEEVANKKYKEKLEKAEYEIQKERLNTDLDREKKLEKAEYEIRKERLNADLDRERTRIRGEKITDLKEAYNGRPKDFWYFIKYVWSYLDTGWKKVLAIFIIWTIVASIIDSIMKVFK